MNLEKIFNTFEGAPPEAIELLLNTRKVVLQTIPKATESIVWNALSYHDSNIGGRVKGAICQVDLHKSNVKIGFIHGANLSDPEALLQGNQKSKRFLFINSEGDLKNKAFLNLLEEAAMYPSILFMGTI